MNPYRAGFYLFLNTVFSITIILLNKWIYAHGIFPNITLSMLHFLVTFLGLHVCQKLGIFERKSVLLDDIFLLAISFCGFVVLTNLSLEYNSVGTFQVAKMLTTPGVVIIQSIYYKKQFSVLTLLTLVPVLVGVTVCFCYDIHFNLIGTIFAITAVIITSLYQVLVNTKQSELQLDSMQLLYYQAPLSAILLCFCIPVFEHPFKSFTHTWTFLDLIMVFISCCAALFVNLTTYWIIGNTSPLTYNMLGHSKFVLITIGGWYLFEENTTFYQLIGIALTLSGIVAYTHVKIKDSGKKKQERIESVKKEELC